MMHLCLAGYPGE